MRHRSPTHATRSRADMATVLNSRPMLTFRNLHPALAAPSALAAMAADLCLPLGFFLDLLAGFVEAAQELGMRRCAARLLV